MHDLLRRLARHQWVRVHGTPRVTVLVGAQGAELWERWLVLAERPGTLVADGFDAAIRAAVARAVAEPAEPIGVAVAADELAAWRAAHTGPADGRLRAMIAEGLVELPAAPPAAPISIAALDARSAAEAALFEALEATPATAGRFALNASLPIRFGSRAAEVDLLSRADGIAIEIDGIHHFADPACYRRDRKKDLVMQGQGLLVVRVLAEDVLRDTRDAIAAVCQALAYRAAPRD